MKKREMPIYVKRIKEAVNLAEQYGQIPGTWHKTWVIDQMVRVLLGPDEYERFIEAYEMDGYKWDVGIAP